MRPLIHVPDFTVGQGVSTGTAVASCTVGGVEEASSVWRELVDGYRGMWWEVGREEGGGREREEGGLTADYSKKDCGPGRGILHPPNLEKSHQSSTIPLLPIYPSA